MEQEIAQLVNLTEMEHMFLQRRGKHFNKIILMFYGGVGCGQQSDFYHLFFTS